MDEKVGTKVKIGEKLITHRRRLIQTFHLACLVSVCKEPDSAITSKRFVSRREEEQKD